MGKQITLDSAAMVIDPLRTVSEIVRWNYRTAPVFKKYGINYCCGGQVALQVICSSMGIPQEVLLDELQEATRTSRLPEGLQFSEWKTDFLVDYIINVHHAYLYKALPEIGAGLFSFMSQHKKQYPELSDIYETFENLSAILLTHNRNEETITFPYIKHLATAFDKGESYAQLFVRTLRKPLSNMLDEHTHIGSLLKKLEDLTGNYQFTEKACTTHQVIYHKLQELHNDLMQHKHLENNILFPRATEIERVLLLH